MASSKTPSPRLRHVMGRSLHWLFAFLRAGEFTVPSQHAYDPRAHFSLLDIAFDSYTAPKVVCLHLKKSKTDPFRQGIDIYGGATGSDVCPVSALLQYIGDTLCLYFTVASFSQESERELRELSSRLAWNTRTSMAQFSYWCSYYSSTVWHRKLCHSNTG